jgi:hypothetical protein
MTSEREHAPDSGLRLSSEDEAVLRKRLLTCDGKGVAYKEAALAELLRRRAGAPDSGTVAPDWFVRDFQLAHAGVINDDLQDEPLAERREANWLWQRVASHFAGAQRG